MEVLYTHKTLEQSVLHTTTAHMFELSVWYKLDYVSDSCFTIVTQSIQVEICRNMVIKDTGSALVDCSQCESVQKLNGVDRHSQSFVTVQSIHCCKVCISHSNNDERHGKP